MASRGERFDYLRYLGYDKFEQRVRLESGNGVVADYTYNPDNRRLARLVAGRAGTRPFQNLAYGYDAVGNITTLKHLPPHSPGGGL